MIMDSPIPIISALRGAGSRQNAASYYHLADVPIADQPCRGLACFVARYRNREKWEAISPEQPKIYCLGKCYAAPACGLDQTRPSIVIDAPRGIVLARVVKGGARKLADYAASGGYTALAKWLRKRPEELLDEIERSGLRGRGGAGFPTAKKWRAVAAEATRPKYLVVNADEGDPGAFIDRFILEDDPHAVIEACVLTGYAIGASKGIVYARKEYPDAQRILAAAIDEARLAGFLGSNVADTGFVFELELVSGQGSYVCGEETSLLNSLEGRPPLVRARPPYPSQQGLWGRPTLVNNVETLANIPWILREGGEAYHALGFSRSQGTKVFSLNSLFRRPGLYEVEFGVPVRYLVEELGGGLNDGVIRGLILGGPLAAILPPELFDTPLGFDELQQVGASLGHGGLVAFNEQTSLPELMHHVFEFAAEESCGECTPCRIGSRVVEEVLRRALENGSTSRTDEEFLREVVSALHATSLCGLGTGLGEFAASALKHFPEDFARAFRND